MLGRETPWEAFIGEASIQVLTAGRKGPPGRVWAKEVIGKRKLECRAFLNVAVSPSLASLPGLGDERMNSRSFPRLTKPPLGRTALPSAPRT